MFVEDIIIALILGLIFALVLVIVAGIAGGPMKSGRAAGDGSRGKSEVPAHTAATVNKLAFWFLLIVLVVATFAGYMIGDHV
jgi:hypothetical protein